MAHHETIPPINIIFKGPGFYSTDNRAVSPVDTNTGVVAPIAHVGGCSCESCSTQHHGHDHQPETMDAATQTPVESPTAAELMTERKYLALNHVSAEALAIGQFLPIVELVEVQQGNKKVVQGRVGIMYKTANGKRIARTMRHTVPLEGFTFSKDASPQILEKNFRVLQTAAMIDAPAVLATLLYDNPAYFGNAHSGNTPNHLVTGISTTKLALQQMQAKSEGNQKGLAQVSSRFSTLGVSGKHIVHGLHDGVDVQRHESVGGTATVSWTENEHGQLVDLKGKKLVAAYVLPGVALQPDLGINNRVLQLPIAQVAEKLSTLQSAGIMVPDAPSLVSAAMTKLESAGDEPFLDEESRIVTNIGEELIRDVAEAPKKNQFPVAERAKQ